MGKKMKKISVYGKGGIGKSTTVSNVSCALAGMGYKVMQIGCDPKSDSTGNLQGGRRIPTILHTIMEKGEETSLEDIVFIGDNGVICAEAGGPTPGKGCAGKGIVTAFEELNELDAYEVYQPDIVIYDVLGDVVCGGFAMPLRDGYADEVYVVTSGEKMSIYAANNIIEAARGFQETSDLKIGGLILNGKNIAKEQELVTEFSEEINVPIVANIPRCDLIQQAEEQNKTVTFLYPDSEQASIYRELAKVMAKGIE